MSVYRFPNATEDKVDQLGDLFDKLLGAQRTDPQIKPILELILNAHTCAIFEMILSSREIQAHVTYDPVIVSQMRDILRTCT